MTRGCGTHAGCEHARFIRSVVSSWRLAEVFLLCEELEAGAALRDLATQAELAREPAHTHTYIYACNTRITASAVPPPKDAHNILLELYGSYVESFW